MTKTREEPLANPLRVSQISEERYRDLAIKTDRLFAVLLAFEWIAGIFFAFWLSPLSWIGISSQSHIHVYAAVFLGGLIAGLPISLVMYSPGARFNRMVIAVAQMLFSILLIHLTGGRIETHFHIFVSLAFLSAYRDWRPIVAATIVTTIDHFVRGALWPTSVYGVLAAGSWRAMEHAAWVLFEDAIVLYTIRIAVREIDSISMVQAQLEQRSADLTRAHLELAHLNGSLEQKVAVRTRELEDSQQTVVHHQQNLVNAGKLAALGEMAGGIAHEINNPLAIISLRVERLENMLKTEFDRENFASGLAVIGRTVERIAKIVSGLKFFARDGLRSPPQVVLLSSLLEETLGFCRERFNNHGVELRIVKDQPYGEIDAECQNVELSQVVLNLLNNAFDAVSGSDAKWIQIQIRGDDDSAEISITDSGTGIHPDLREKIMQPFFTTKGVGKGTGLGLSISKGIVETHGGTLTLDERSLHTRFVIRLPRRQPYASDSVAS